MSLISLITFFDLEAWPLARKLFWKIPPIEHGLLMSRATARYISNYYDIHHVGRLWNVPLKIKIFLLYFYVDLIYHAV